MELRRYVAPGRSARAKKQAPTLVPGTVNENGQEVLGPAGRAPDDLPGQRFQRVKCRLCGHTYAEAGIRVHGRRCPKCGGGKPGKELLEPEQANLFE